MPAASDMRASRRLSWREPDQRSGTSVTARPDEQLGPNRPILSTLALYMLMRSRIDVWGASKCGPLGSSWSLLGVGDARFFLAARRPSMDGWTGFARHAKYRHMPDLFSPIRLGPAELPNR